MNNLFLTPMLFAFLFVVSIGNAQSCPVPEPLDVASAIGKWEGNFTLDGEIKTLELNLSENNGKLNALLTIPFIRKKSFETETEICQSEELHIEFDVNDKTYELIGRIKDESMSGRLASKNKSSMFFKNTSEDSVQELFSMKKI